MPHYLLQPPTPHISGSQPARATATTTNASTVSTDEHPSSGSTFLVLLFFYLPPFTACLSQFPWALHVPFIKPIMVSAAILMTLLLARAYTVTMFERFSHPAGVVLQFLDYNIIIMVYAIDLYLSAIQPGPGTATTHVIGCALTILVVIIAQVVFWAIVASKCSEERLGLYAYVQCGLYWIREWLFFFIAGLFGVVRDVLQLLAHLIDKLKQLYASDSPQFTDTVMTPPPHYSLYDNTEDSMHRLSNVDKV
ncbi:hypothetical protein CY34DRAFT_800354 [Suillus luteus UH-Slu-Lm8-n1]|uniref:Uncharacterized protein n=1 Tax=Suillus luteus UH-Slu-Lm8-n1 TaxID=930992 RepID=A0A0D0A8S1_9AGAM|nr:hypothetical protein CY34DRAFT_800354 [Suillus luteus UH-Slu-Lm8-n1]